MELEELQSRYANLTPEAHEVTTWNFLLRELPSPVFIGLERSIEKGSIHQRLPQKRLYKSGGGTPRTTASTLMRDAFNTCRRQLVENNDNLNRKVLELSFSGVISDKSLKPSHSPKTTATKIQQLKSRFESTKHEGAYSKTLYSEEVRTAIVKYLDQLSSILSKEDKKDDVWVMLNQHNFERAATMFDLFEQHELKVQGVQQEIINFSKAVNRFIEDSGKTILFDDDTGTPFFKSNTSLDKLGFSELSSGESQIVTLLSYFAFLAKEGIPIIIDEPELSLHVQWQKYFVSAVKTVMPDECQTIMATHSPEICGAENVNVQSISVRVTK